MNFFKNKSQAGFSLVELIVAIGVFAILASGVTYVVTNSYTNFYGIGDKQSIAEFAQEGLEAVRSIRENSWQYIENNVGSNLGIAKDGNRVWTFSGSSNTLGDLTRVIIISNASRDTDGNITEGVGNIDPLTKKVTVTISASGIDDYVLNTYLTSWSNRTWEQTDWSGGVGTQFWSYENQAYTSSSMDGITTAGNLTLEYVPGAMAWGWSDLTDFSSTTSYGSSRSYASLIDDLNDHWYICGSSSYLQRFDISNARTTGLSSPSTVSALAGRAIALTPSSTIDHLYMGGDNSVIKTISTSTFSVLKTYVPATNLSYLYAFAINDIGDHMYAAGTGGIIFSLDIAQDGTLSCDNCTLWCDTKKDPKCKADLDTPEVLVGATYPINALWLDDANDKLYLSSDSPTNAMARIDVSNTADLSLDYGFSYTQDITDFEYLGENPSGDLRFIIGTDYNSSATYPEFAIIDSDGSSFTKVAGVDLSAESGKSIYVRDVHYTNNNEVFIDAEDYDGVPYAYLYAIEGVTTLAAPEPSVKSGVTENSLFGYGHTYYHPSAYSNTQGGIFGVWSYAGASTRYAAYLEQVQIPGVGVYDSTGTLSSSKLDIGSTDQELHSVTISQNIPTSCDIDITLYADDNSSFSSATSQVFSSTTSDFTEEVNSDMQGERWLYYKVDMTSCSSDTATPTLYSFRLNYN